MQNNHNDSGKDRTAKGKQRIAEHLKERIGKGECQFLAPYSQNTVELFAIYRQYHDLGKRVQRFIKSNENADFWKHIDSDKLQAECNRPLSALVDLVEWCIVDGCAM